jgi:hydrogenase nickel incorporation protein HypA/HybF
LHELSIAMEILDIVRKEAASHGATSVSRVRLRIGGLSGVETDSLSFCFEAVKGEGSLTAGAELVIDNVPVRVRCHSCGGEFSDGGYMVTCPSCGSLETTLLSGEELEIADIEID